MPFVKVDDGEPIDLPDGYLPDWQARVRRVTSGPPDHPTRTPEPAMAKPAPPVTPIRPRPAVRVTPAVQLAEAALSCCSGAPCGEPLTGGGAPRGWVLVRTIGGGAPRRFCGWFCAAAAIISGPPRLASVPASQPEKREANRVTGKPKRRAYTADEKRAWVESYVRDHLTIEQVAARHGASFPTVAAAIRAAGVSRPRGTRRVTA